MRTTWADGVATVSTDALDASNAEQARLFVEDVVAGDDGSTAASGLVLDLSDTPMLDSAGLGFLVATRTRCLDLGASFELASVPPRVQRTIVLSGLAELLGVADNGPRQLPDANLLPPVADRKFDQLAELTRRAVDAPSAYVSLVSKQVQVHPGLAGAPASAAREVPLEESYCRHVVTTAAPMIVTDARQHPLLAGNPAIERGAVAYAGMPITDLRGNVVGSLCVVDDKPRRWTPAQLETLADMAAVASSELQLRMAVTDSAVSADRERIAADLNDRVFKELLSLAMLLGSAQSITTGPAGKILDEAAFKVDEILKSLRGAIFDRKAR